MSDIGPPTVQGLWGDEKYADATVIMDAKVWRIHRWVVCHQSAYFMRAYDGNFKESKTMTVDLSNGEFTEGDVQAMLKFLYTHELDYHQKANPLMAFMVADYFQVDTLRTKALVELKQGLHNIIVGGSFVNFKRWALRILEEHSDTDLEQTLVTVTASNLKAVICNSILPATWNDIVQKHPFFANKVLLKLISTPEGARAGLAGSKRSAGVAFDDHHIV